MTIDPRALAAAALLLLGGAAPAPTAPNRTMSDPLLTWPDLLSRPRPKVDATISYGPAELQKVDLWLPSGPGPHPVVLMVHGGCWQSSIADRTIMDWIAADLRVAGVAVWNIDYRGVDRPGGGYPGTFADVAAAADALRVHAERYRLDLRHVVTVGHSAGGHLALWLAARAKLPRSSPLFQTEPLKIAHAISLGGLPDLELTAATPENGCGAEVVEQLTGGRFADTSIPRLLPLGVPQDLVNGHEDQIIPFAFATRYITQVRAKGDRVALHTAPRTGHAELIAPETAAWAETRRLILAALNVPSSGRGGSRAAIDRPSQPAPSTAVPARGGPPSPPARIE